MKTGPGSFRRIERKDTRGVVDRTSCAFSNGSTKERVLIAINKRRKNSDRVSVGSYYQACEVSRGELQKGHEDLCRKEASGRFLRLYKDCHPRSLTRPVTDVVLR